jgi:hypothetical protein
MGNWPLCEDASPREVLCKHTILEIDGTMVACTPIERSDLFAVAEASIWTDTQAILTYTARMRASTMDLERETLERVICICPIGQSMSIMTENPALCDEWNRAFQGKLNEEEAEQWKEIGRFVSEYRSITS